MSTLARMALIAAATAVALWAVFGGGAQPAAVVHPTAVEVDHLKASAQSVINGLEYHRERYGRYPVALPVESLTRLATEHGNWGYASDGLRFELALDGADWQLTYDSRRRIWASPE